MTHAMLIFALLFGITAPTFAQSDEVDAETLRRLAALIGEKPQIDPQLEELLKKMIENKQIDPKLLDQARKMVEADPERFRKLAQEKAQNPGQLNKIIEEFRPQPNPSLPPNIAPPLPPQPMPTPPVVPPRQPEIPGVRPEPGPRPPFPQQVDPPPFEPRFAPPSARPDPSKNQDYQALVKFWESNVGPIDKTPEVQKAFMDVFSNVQMDGDKGGLFQDMFNGNPDGSPTNGSQLLDWLKRQGGNSNWNLPSWGGSAPEAPNWMRPGTPSGLSGPDVSGISIAGLGATASSMVLIAIAAVIGFLLYRYWPAREDSGKDPRPLHGLGPWPLDPRSIRTREELVLAFDYVSQLECGPQAVAWNHMVIARALRKFHPESSHFADELAELYGVARYAPTAEEMTPDQIRRARQHLCTLAGVSA